MERRKLAGGRLMEYKKKMKLLNAAIVIDFIALIGIFAGGFLNSVKIIGGCMMLILLSVVLMISTTE